MSSEFDPNHTLHVYVRVSTTSQADKGTSLESQEALGKKKAAELGLACVVWNEGGRSSHHEDLRERPKFYELLQAIKRGIVKNLWVYDQSRLSRNDFTASILRHELTKHSVTLYTNDASFDFASHNDKLHKQLLDAVAEFENSQRAQRTRLGKLMKVKAGFWQGGPPPYGYKLQEGKLAVRPIESDWVKYIFKEASRGVSAAVIKRTLDSNGVLARRGRLWSLGSLEAMMKNTHYMGWYTFKDRLEAEPVLVQCPALVDEATWNAVNLTRKREASRKDQRNATTRNFYLLRDFMICGHCGRKMAGRIKHSKAEQMYYCPNKERTWAKDGGSVTPYARGTGCGFERAMNIQTTDDLVFNTVLMIHGQSSVLKEEIKRRIATEQGITYVASDEEIKTYERQLRKAQKALSDLQESIGEFEARQVLNPMSDRSMHVARKQLQDREQTLKLDIANVQLQLKGEGVKRQWVDWIGSFGETIPKNKALTPEEKQKYLQGLIERIDCKYLPDTRDHELTIHFKHAIVGDGIKWNSPNTKAKGYKVIEGSKTTQIRVEKRDGRGK